MTAMHRRSDFQLANGRDCASPLELKPMTSTLVRILYRDFMACRMLARIVYAKYTLHRESQDTCNEEQVEQAATQVTESLKRLWAIFSYSASGFHYS